MKTKGSEPMSWFDDIFGQSKNEQKNEKQKSDQVSFDHHPDDDSTNEEIYRRPKGKFRFPIQMEYEEQINQEHHQHDNETSQHEEKYHDSRFYDESSASFPTNRRRRRRNRNVDAYEPAKKSRSYDQDVTHHYETKSKQSSQRYDNSKRYNDDYQFEERLNALHQPKFKASEVPSAIFGMRKQKEVPNSGLKDHSTKPSDNDTEKENKLKQSSEIVRDVPTYSKTDNTINIENIYASQIVSEIRKEREKKLQKKKQFEKALREKREQELNSLDSEETKSQIKNQDYYLKQQASYIKNDPKDYQDVEDEQEALHDDLQSDIHHDELSDHQEETANSNALQPDVNDLTTYEFKEIDLDFDDIEDDIKQDNVDEVIEEVDTENEVVNSTHDSNEEDASEFEEVESSNEVEEISGAEAIQHFEEDNEVSNEEVIEPSEIIDTHDSLEEDDASITQSEQFVEDDIHFEEVEDSEAEEIETIDNAEDVLTFDETEEDNNERLFESDHFDVENDTETQEADNVIAEEELNNDPKETENTVQEPEQHEEPKETTSHEPILKPKSVRKSSPFNVMMTPSDKRKHQAFKNSSNINKTQTSNIQETESETQNEQNESNQAVKRKGPSYVLPPVSILDDVVEEEDNSEWLEEKKKELDEAFYHFNVPAHVVNMIQGPTVTRFELSVEKGVKVSRITALQDDIKMALAAKDIRIEAPIPGTSLVGIEVPNQSPKKIPLGQMITSKPFQQAESKLTVAMGFKINNEPLLMDIAKTPHALIAGATGSGKSVCINAILTSLLYKNHPDELKLLLIDPKMVELAPYNNLPHLVAPVITDVKAATASLKWAVEEMERRYKRFAELHVRNITAFNKKANYEQRMAKIIIVIDELADLMMMSPQEVEQSIARIAQKARACGIHMILATQRPSVNVITGLIKANVPTRISFMVSSSIDSRTILDVGGAEKLLGNGDMLYLGNGMNKPIRVQGAFVSDDEIDETVENVSSQMKPNYLFKEETLLKKVNEQPADALFDEVCEFMLNEGHISTSLIQRHFQIGYNRAARMIDNLEERGYISGPNGSKPRDVLITKDMIEERETNI
ncbi:DNA translocase FtsK [Mammaliicoccus sciuri]|uniref:DNA translocase FtsK n=2 Tax=Mammaliicoccus sciuri TaxID=1296 RepID=UPI000734D3F1|nr:DNA translocase FtsK [Mammaliicoccus sciuri]WQJ43335.1 DNA translocase FtsK [Mammaliicoccus sciuri]WQK43558.1 DNA translocase FtsK [Mammaliicoccus sciuri]WQK58952.1 DNA translocase FtsK [Mammaliicoccus sciuri]WQK72436.1 DNA translocase FtsK [Mammaliicoccus sciuri]WQL93716.1 DNA translocase FtsK [Mammaliicoccus sciuri]